jgi:exosortase
MQTSNVVLNSNQSTGAAAVGRQRNPAIIFTLVVGAVCWGFVFNVLRVDWSINPQYHYGWFVPLLALGLFRLRWTTRPAIAPLHSLRTVVLLATGSLALLLPIRLVEEANPEWRLVQWIHALQMVLVTLCALYYAGGRPWVRHFLFPVCFLLVAVPWPVPLEQPLVQNLMRAVAGVTVELVNLLNIPAVQYGNVIQINSGLVGIDEACSGVRSLQTAFFICLFLGELYRFSWTRRLMLLLLGFLTALICNVGRTFYLVYTASHHGIDRLHAVHDTAGQIVLVVTILGILGIAYLLRRPLTITPTTAAPSARSLPFPIVAACLAWALLTEVATEAWYRLHETQTLENARWSVTWPAVESAESVPLDSGLQTMLRFNDGRAETWKDDSGNHWQAFFFRWEPGRNSAQLATAHTPDICLRGAGYELSSDLGVRTVPVKDINLPFRQYVFTHGSRPLHVFYCRWEDQTTRSTGDLGEDGSKGSRFRAVLAGHRHLGQQVLEVAVNGVETPEDALAAFTNQLPQLVHR